MSYGTSLLRPKGIIDGAGSRFESIHHVPEARVDDFFCYCPLNQLLSTKSILIRKMDDFEYQ